MMNILSLGDAHFWFALLQIIIIDILLGGDNAMVIALAARNLPKAQQKKIILLGTLGAILLRLVLLLFAVKILEIIFLKMIGGILLLWIGIRLLLPEEKADHRTLKGDIRMTSAIKTVIFADLVMSFDNVVAVAGAARDNFVLVILGILISIPIIIWGSQLVLKLIQKFPVLILLGAALLGYIGGQMITSDPFLKSWMKPWIHYLVAIIGALLVVIIGKWLSHRKLQKNL